MYAAQSFQSRNSLKKIEMLVRTFDHRASVEQSLSELGCGYLDLLLVHWPEAWMPLPPGAGFYDHMNGGLPPVVDTEASLQVSNQYESSV